MPDLLKQSKRDSLAESAPKQKKNRKQIVFLAAFSFLVLAFLSKIYIDNKQSGKEMTYLMNGSLQVLGVEDTVGDSVKETMSLAKSENYSVSQLNLSGMTGSADGMLDFEANGLLEVRNVKAELYTVKNENKEEVRAVVGFQTNKKSTVEVSYLKSGEKNSKIIKSDQYGLSHILIIPELESDSVYRYLVRARDMEGNKVGSDQFVFYTGAPNISLIDVLENAAQKVFGWAMGAE